MVEVLQRQIRQIPELTQKKDWRIMAPAVVGENVDAEINLRTLVICFWSY